jgi:hypothetical protein
MNFSPCIKQIEDSLVAEHRGHAVDELFVPQLGGVIGIDHAKLPAFRVGIPVRGFT